jgi:hypothetical protein
MALSLMLRKYLHNSDELFTQKRVEAERTVTARALVYAAGLLQGSSSTSAADWFDMLDMCEIIRTLRPQQAAMLAINLKCRLDLSFNPFPIEDSHLEGRERDEQEAFRRTFNELMATG